ncbi:MAG: hypothetical protein IKL09_07750, partial [Clostridia bacterium]|nr:hypothetical protein [Clostridia bacterium]
MADKEKDYSEYKMDNHERYYSLRANNQYLKFDYFSNQARFDEIKKSIHFFIDSSREDFAMQDEMEKSDLQHGRSLEDDLTPQDIADYEESDAEQREKNEQYREYFRKKHGIDFNKSEYFCQSKSDVSFNNIFCGSKFSINVGKGILDFIYADFNTPYKEEQQFAYAMEFLWPKLAEEFPDEHHEKLKEIKQKYDDIKSEPVKVLSIEDEIYDDY